MRSGSKYQPLYRSRFQPTYKAEGSRGQPAVYLGEPMDVDVQARRIARPGRKHRSESGCWECGGTDHWYEDCPKLRRGLFQGSGRRKDARRGTRGSRVKRGKSLKRRGMDLESDSEYEELEDIKRGPHYTARSAVERKQWRRNGENSPRKEDF